MKIFKLFNNIFGWIVFAIAASVYLLTIEPTTSFWDCGEFIATGYKLEVGHPPGNPSAFFYAYRTFLYVVCIRPFAGGYDDECLFGA